MLVFFDDIFIYSRGLRGAYSAPQGGFGNASETSASCQVV